jgi:hypothetical protein
MSKSAGFAPQNRQKRLKMTPKPEKHAILTPKRQFSGLNRSRQAK